MTKVKMIIFALLGCLLLIAGFAYFRYFYGDAHVLFALDDKMANYTLIKLNTGEFVLEYRKDNKKVAAFIGYSNTNLNHFVNNKVHVKGVFRKKYGSPLCYEACIGASERKSPIIDLIYIENIN